MKFLLLIVLISVGFFNIQGFYLKNNNEVKNQVETDSKLEKENIVREKPLVNSTSSNKSIKIINIIEDVVKLFTKTLQLKLRERAPNSPKNSTLNKFLEILESSNKSRKTRSVPIVPNDPQTRSNNDWPEFTSKSEFEEYKMMETQHLNSLKQEIKKLDDLLHLLQDQQKILTVLNNYEGKTNDVSDEKQYLKLLKLASNMKCSLGLDNRSTKELNDENSIDGSKQPLEANKEVLQNLTQQIGELKGLLKSKSSQDKENERYLLESLEDQKRKLEKLEDIVERIPNNLNVAKSPSEPLKVPEVNLRSNVRQWVERSPSDNPETVPPHEDRTEFKPWIGITNPPLPNGQRDFGIVGSPLLVANHNHPLLGKSWAPKSRSSNSDRAEYSRLLHILQENKLKSKPILKDQREIQKTKIKPKMSSEDDDLMENLEKLLDSSNRQSKAKESFNSQSDIEKRLLELQRQLEISEQFNKIENKIAQLNSNNEAETKSLDTSSENDLKEQIKKLNAQLKKLDKNNVESKSLDDDDLKRELKNLQLRNELKNLQSAIDNLKPKDESVDNFAKDGSFEFQSMLNQLINVDDDGNQNQHTSHLSSGSHLNPSQIQFIRQKMRGYGNGHKRPHSQASVGGYGVPNYPYGNFYNGEGQYGGLNDFSDGHAYGNGFSSGGSSYDNKYGGGGYANFNNIYGPYANELDQYGSSNVASNRPYGRPHSSYNSYGLPKHQSLPYNPLSWSQYSQQSNRPYESNGNQYKPGSYNPNSKPYLNYDNRNPHDYFGASQYGLDKAKNPNDGYNSGNGGHQSYDGQQYNKNPNNVYNAGNGAPNYFPPKPYDGQQYNKNPNDGPQAQYNNRVVPPPYLPKPDQPITPSLPTISYNKQQEQPAQNIFYEPPNEAQDNPPFNVHNIFEQLAYGGGQTESTSNFQNFPNSEPPTYKTSVNVDAPNSPQPYGNSQENPPPSGAHSQQQVGDLKNQIYNLQNVINNLNQPNYAQTPADRETVYKLDKRITDLKDVINQISVDSNYDEYAGPNQQPPQQQQPPPPPPNYQEISNVPPATNAQPDKPNDPNYAPPIQRSLMRRSPFIPLTDFSKLSQAIKATVAQLVNQTQNEETRFKRQDEKHELDKQIAMHEFLLQLHEMANAISYLSEGLFAPKNNSTDSDAERRKKRNVKQNEIVDLNEKINKLMNVVSCLEKSVQNKMCNCLKNEGVKRKKRENRAQTQEAVNKIASILSNIIDEELQHKSVPREQPISLHHNNPKLLQEKIEELKKQLDQKIQNRHQTNPFFQQATFYHPYKTVEPSIAIRNPSVPYTPIITPSLAFKPIQDPPVSYKPTEPSARYNSYGSYKHDFHTELKSGDSLVEKIVAKIIKQSFASLAEVLPSFLKQLLSFALGSLFNFGNDYGYDGDQSVDYRESGVSYQPKGLGFLGMLPMILLKLITGLTSFVKQLQKNKFIRNFLVPVLIAGLSAGLVLFLVWWFTSSDGYDDYNKNLYITNDNYYKYSQDYTDEYKNNFEKSRSANFIPNVYKNQYFNQNGYQKNNNYMNTDSNYYKYS